MVRQVLVEVRERVFVGREALVVPPQDVTGGHRPEAVQVDDVQRRDVVRPATQKAAPVALLPEAEAVHVLAVVAHRGVAIGRWVSRPHVPPCKSISTSSYRSARTIWSASTKMTRSRSSGKSTSRNRILYAQMVRCFSVWARSHCGQAKVIIS